MSHGVVWALHALLAFLLLSQRGAKKGQDDYDWRSDQGLETEAKAPIAGAPILLPVMLFYEGRLNAHHATMPVNI